MSRDELIRKLGRLSEAQFAEVAPFLEADLDAVDELATLHQEIEAGRRSAKDEPLLDAREVYARARKALSQ